MAPAPPAKTGLAAYSDTKPRPALAGCGFLCRILAPAWHLTLLNFRCAGSENHETAAKRVIIQRRA